MLGANHLVNLTSTQNQAAALVKPYATDKTMAQSAEALAYSPTPAWVPWAVGAAIGGIVLYFAVRK